MRKLTLTDEQRQIALEQIKTYFYEERDEQIGELQSRLLLDFIIEKVGPQIYNQAIVDMQKYMSERVEDMYAYML